MGSLEKVVHVMKEITTPMVNALGITSEEPLTPEIINDSLRHLVNMHTLLRVRVKRMNDIPYFCNVDEDIINTVEAEIREDVDWNKVIDEHREGSLFKNGLLWKCIFLPNGKMGSG